MPNIHGIIKTLQNIMRKDAGVSGDAMKDFVDIRLFPSLQNLDVTDSDGGVNARAVLVRDIFAGTNNYMKNGTIMRQVVNKLNEIDFNASEDRHVFGDIYESLLRDLQSAGNYGEFYTPRVVTEIVNSRLGEVVFESKVQSMIQFSDCLAA